MRKLGVCLAALVAGGGVAAAQDADELGRTCAAAWGSGGVATASIIDACTFVIQHPADQGSLARALRYRGLAFERQKDFRQAVADLDEALRLAPDDDLALEARARVHRALGDVAGAAADYRRLAERYPNETRWRIELSQLGAPAASPPSYQEAPKRQAQAEKPAKLQAREQPVMAEVKPSPAQEPGLSTRNLQSAGGHEIRQTELSTDPALVSELQRVLNEIGYDAGPINGRLERQTREAMRRFAADVRLQPGQDGERAVLAAAREELRLRQEEAAADQRDLNRRAQAALSALGYDPGPADGVFGPGSRAALAQWAVRRGEEAPGAVEEMLVAELETAAAAEMAAPDQDVAQGVAPPDEADLTAAPTPPDVGLASGATGGPGEPEPEPPSSAAPPYAATERQREQAEAAQAEQASPVAPPRQPPALPALPSTGGKRVALVIGNSAYEHATPLRNPRRDAEDLAAALEDIGFEVLEGFDLGRDELERRAIEFAEKAATADLALAYYSGHGLQFENRNYLVPVDAQVRSLRDVRRLVELDQLVKDASEAELAMVVVDACRDNPFKQQLARSLGGARSAELGTGLAKPAVTPPQTLIAYATAGDTVAYDGEGENSPYVEALLKHIRTPDLEVRLLFGKVRDDVIRATENQQWPDTYASLGGDPVYLVRSPPKPTGLGVADLTAGERRALQRSLAWLGSWDGPMDGEPTEGLREAVRAYQRDRGDPDTGLLSPREAIDLHRLAALRRPPEPLPPVSMLGLLRRIQAGDPEALRQAGMIFDPAFEPLPGERKDPKEAAGYYQDAAERGDAPAAARLGLLLSARGRPAAERRQARAWLEQAAEAGDAAAAVRLADLLLAGPDGQANRTEAVRLLRAAAAGGVSPDHGLATARLRQLGELEETRLSERPT